MKQRASRFVPEALALALALCAPASAAAQYVEPPPPAAYALRNVTVVTADGVTSTGVDLIVRDGLVEALGPGVDVPADAVLLEGDSLVVYPGIVDAAAEAEVEFPDPVDAGDDDEATAWAPPRSASGFMPHRRAAHHLGVTGADLDDARAAGVVAGLVHPGGGMAPGQPAAILFRADAKVPWELVQIESAGLTMSFERARGVYPSQLFGVIAYLRQAFLDARRYDELRGSWAADAEGMTAPAWDPDYEALLGALEGDRRIFFHADSDEDIRRVLNLADEFGFRPIIVGGTEAWKLAGELADRGVEVLVTTDFPEPDEWDPDAEGELEPGAAREKEEIEAAWANAGRLEDAGVTFALTSGGGEGDIVEGARKVVEHGLSPEGALRAMTSVPAAIVGLPAVSRIGVGRPATFLVADGELFSEETGIVYTFVEGRLERGEALDEEAGEGSEPSHDVTGRWTGTFEFQGNTMEFTFDLEMEEGGALEGTLTSAMMGSSDLEGSVSGDAVSIRIEAEGMPEAIRVEATLSEDGTEMTGSGRMPMGEIEFTATREPGAGERGGVR